MQILQKKILFINLSNQISGAEISLKYILENLDYNIFDCYLASPVLLTNKEEVKYLPINYIFIKKSWSPFYYISTIFYIFYLVFSILYRINGIKISIIVSNTTKSNIVGLMLKIFLNAKLVWFVRDNIENSFIKYFFSRYSNKIICTSNSINNQIKGFEEKKNIIPNIYEPKCELEIKDEQSIYSKNEIIIAQIGQLIPWKNHIDSIKAFDEVYKRHKNIIFLIIGVDLFNHHKEYVLELKKSILNKSTASKIIFLGQIYDIGEYYSKIDILVHPAKNEPFGRVVIEAMYHQIPVVAYNSGGPAEIIKNKITGFLVIIEDGYKGIADKLNVLIENKFLRISLGKKGSEEIKLNYCSQKIIPQIQNVFLNA